MHLHYDIISQLSKLNCLFLFHYIHLIWVELPNSLTVHHFKKSFRHRKLLLMALPPWTCLITSNLDSYLNGSLLWTRCCKLLFSHSHCNQPLRHHYRQWRSLVPAVTFFDLLLHSSLYLFIKINYTVLFPDNVFHTISLCFTCGYIMVKYLFSVVSLAWRPGTNLCMFTPVCLTFSW